MTPEVVILDKLSAAGLFLTCRKGQVRPFRRFSYKTNADTRPARGSIAFYTLRLLLFSVLFKQFGGAVGKGLSGRQHQNPLRPSYAVTF